jgi:hypothetical protein
MFTTSVTPIHTESGQPLGVNGVPSISTSRSNVHAILQNIQTLCKEEIYPIGSIVTSFYVVQNIKRILNVLAVAYIHNSTGNASTNIGDYNSSITPHSATTSIAFVVKEKEEMFHESIHALLQLLARLSREPSVDDANMDATASAPLTSLPAKFYHGIFRKWKDAAILLPNQHHDHSVVWSATEMAQFLIDHGISEIPMSSFSSSDRTPSTSSSTFQFLKYDTFTISTVLQVALHQNSALLAPNIIKSLWEKFNLNQCTVENDESIIYSYNVLLQSYANSEQEDATTKLETVWNEMQSRNVQPNVASYHIRLKHYRELNKLPEMESFIKAAVTATPRNSSSHGKTLPGDVWQQPRELSLSCWHEVIQCYMNAAKDKYNIERNNSLLYIHKGQTILQQIMIPQWIRHQSTGESEKVELSKCIHSIITTYRYVLQQPKYEFDVQHQSSLKSNPLKLSIQQRVINNNPITYHEQQTRDRILESAVSFYQFMNRQNLKDVCCCEYTMIQ